VRLQFFSAAFHADARYFALSTQTGYYAIAAAFRRRRFAHFAFDADIYALQPRRQPRARHDGQHAAAQMLLRVHARVREDVVFAAGFHVTHALFVAAMSAMHAEMPPPIERHGVVRCATSEMPRRLMMRHFSPPRPFERLRRLSIDLQLLAQTFAA
jgi:hypothetical protein